MGLLILEPPNASIVPGTVILDQLAAHGNGITSNLKQRKWNTTSVILAPQPSEDPNDPLNWPKWKRGLVFYIILFGLIIHGMSPLLNPGIVQISQELNRPVTDIAELISYMLITSGVSGLFVSALGRKYGKRPVYVTASILGTVAVIIAEVATGYNVLLASRVLQGISVVAYESLASATVGDLYFVHERGSQIALMIFILTGIVNGVSILAGVITANLGWHYNFHISVPFAALQTILVILFVPETVYRRDVAYETDIAGSISYATGTVIKDRPLTEPKKDVPIVNDPKSEPDEIHIEQLAETEPRTQATRKKTFLQELRLYNAVLIADPLWKLVVACPTILFNVGASYQVIMSGVIVSFNVGISILTGVVFASPPYHLSSATIGYMSTGPLLGSIIATMFCFAITGPMVRWLARRNAGIYEPEFSLLGLIPGCILTLAGLLSWGYSVNTAASIYLICFEWALMLGGMTVISVFATQYALDSFRANSTEVFTMSMIFKNMFFYGITRFIIQWYTEYGPVHVLGIMAGITAFLCLLGFPLYVFGKRYRDFWQRHNMLRILNLETDHLGAEE
ncbi:major facilitator superfamily domain-containing protein [Aspergillus karnatakaensis]|uniref:major facilitator superfamily domain-containing protein n=1 Tax=Aspergillus karnatakaensis TaxID=1810916 RepID=UPI003CCD288B